MFSITKRVVDANGLTPSQVVMLAALSIDDLAWDCYLKDEYHLYARCHMGLFSWGESVSVITEGEETMIACKRPAWKIFNKDRSKKNIDSLIEYMHHNRQIYSAESLQELFKNRMAEHSSGLTPTEKIVMSKDWPLASCIFILVNLIYFLFFSISTNSFFNADIMDVFHWGGNIRLNTLGGEGWRLLTSCFLHLGFLHLAANMFALFFIGRYLEPVLGPVVFSIVYLCTGICGSLVSVLEAGNRLSVGASGAIFGLYGVFLALLTTRLLSGEIKRVLFRGIFIFTAYELFNGMSVGVDNAAHVGGLLSGFSFGYLIYSGIRSARGKRIAIASVMLITMFSTAFCLSFFHNDTVVYDRMLKRMRSIENEALAPRTDMKLKSMAQQITELKTISGPGWTLFKKIADSAAGYRFGMNKIYPVQKGLLSRYAAYRIAENEIWITSLQTGQLMEKQKDSVRVLVYEKYDSLVALFRNSPR